MTDRLRLLGDIGGTNARFAVLRGESLGPVQTIPVAGHPTPETAIEDFLTDHEDVRSGLEEAELAVAAPVTSGRSVRLTNAGWSFDRKSLAAEFGFERVRIFNDLEAAAWSLPDLAREDVALIGKPQQGSADAPIGVIGVGTGFGFAVVTSERGETRVLATEAGHATLAAADDADAVLIRHLRVERRHVSVEAFLSGGGIERLYATHVALGVGPRPMLGPKPAASEISEAGLSGDCALARVTLERFAAMLGSHAGNLALSVGARGGIYLAGGIPPRLASFLAGSPLRQRFEAKGRFREYLAGIPIRVILHPQPTFLGLRRIALEKPPFD